MEKSGAGKLNKKSREFKPKAKPAQVNPTPPAASESKYFKGMLPGQSSNPAPSILPPNMGIKLENGELILPDTLPEGMKKMFQKALDDGMLNQWIKQQVDDVEEDEENEFENLTLEEEQMAQAFLKEQKQMEMCPFYLEGK
jgi:hypothetical protein